MTLSLASRCIGYLCQDHHDLKSIKEDEMRNNILSGAYRLHNFASAYWWILIKQYLVLSKSTSIPDSLIDQLQQLYDRRSADGYQQSDEKLGMGFNMNEAILALEPTRPDLVEMLRNVSQFQSVFLKADYYLQRCECSEPLDDLAY